MEGNAMKKITIVLTVLCLLLAGCSSSISGQKANQASNTNSIYTSNSNNEKNGFLYSDNANVYFMEFTETNNDIMGQLSIFYINSSTLKYETQICAFKGKHNNDKISIEFTGNMFTNAKYGNIWNGTYNTNITFNIPKNDGTIISLLFIKASIDDNNNKINELKNKLGVLQTETDRQKDISSTKTKMGEIIKECVNAINSLTPPSDFSENISTYNERFSQMEEAKSQFDSYMSNRPFTTSDYFGAQGKKNWLHSLLNDINLNTSSINYTIKDENKTISQINQNLSDLHNLLKTYVGFGQQDYNDYQSKVDSIIKSSQSVIPKTESQIKNIQSISNDYTNKAENLYNAVDKFFSTVEVPDVN